MANFIIDDIKSAFKSNNTLTKVILVNVIVFIAFNLIDAITTMANSSAYFLLDFFALKASLSSFIFRFWTIITYQFVHLGFWHILFNMLWLYWFGKIISEYIGQSRFFSIYILGGISGGIMFIAFYNLLYALGLSSAVFNLNAPLIGASGSVMAVVFASATLLPNNKMNLMFIGPVSLKYIALGSLILTTLLDFSSNTGGKLAHLGGAIYGFLYIKSLQNGNDFAAFFPKIVEKVSSLFKAKPKIKVVHRKKRTVSDTEYNTQKKNQQEIVDAILDKISKSGYDSLTKKEKDFLFKYSNKK